MLDSSKSIDIWAYVFLIITQSFLGWLGLKIHWCSKDYYLSIGHDKSKLSCLFYLFIYGTTCGGKRAWPSHEHIIVGVLLDHPLSRNQVFEKCNLPPYYGSVHFFIVPSLLGDSSSVNNWLSAQCVPCPTPSTFTTSQPAHL